MNILSTRLHTRKESFLTYKAARPEHTKPKKHSLAPRQSSAMFVPFFSSNMKFRLMSEVLSPCDERELLDLPSALDTTSTITNRSAVSSAFEGSTLNQETPLLYSKTSSWPSKSASISTTPANYGTISPSRSSMLPYSSDVRMEYRPQLRDATSETRTANGLREKEQGHEAVEWRLTPLLGQFIGLVKGIMAETVEACVAGVWE